MKTQKHKLIFGKTSLVELDNKALNSINGGTGTLPDPLTNTLTPNTLPVPDTFPNPFPNPMPTPIPIPGTGTLPW